MKINTAFLLFFGISLVLSSCGVNTHIMFKTTDEDVIVDDIPISPSDAYRLAPDDKFTFSMYVEDGKRIIDIGSGINTGENESQQLQSGKQIEYLVRNDGKANLPIRSEEHTSELQSRPHLVCRLL